VVVVVLWNPFLSCFTYILCCLLQHRFPADALVPPRRPVMMTFVMTLVPAEELLVLPDVLDLPCSPVVMTLVPAEALLVLQTCQTVRIHSTSIYQILSSLYFDKYMHQCAQHWAVLYTEMFDMCCRSDGLL